MNRSMILYILGWILKLEGIFMALPCLAALIYREKEGLYFVLIAVICLALGLLITKKKPTNMTFYMREGCIATALSWIVLSLMGCLPFFLSGQIPSFADALFETISGFTTTGASVLSDVESLARCMLFWRSFTHWLGGMGVLVFLLAVIKMTGGSHMNLMRAESPGPSVGKLVPKVMQTARILYIIYFGLTVAMVIFLLAGRMPVFDALTTAFGTAGTGGFGIKNDSMASYSPYIQWVVTVFMILFGVNFNAYYLILFKKWRQAFRIEEVWQYLLIIGSAITVIMLTTFNAAMGFLENLRHVSFQVASVITTTGFATVDFDQWSQTARTVMVMLMFVGACAGSTGGGIKVSRITMLIKSVGRELNYYIFPKSVKKIKMDGRPVELDVVRGINVYFVAFAAVFVLSFFCLSFQGTDLVTNFTAVTATINNIGPGLALVGPTQNYGFFSVFSKCVLMFDMLAGRLELFPLLLLLFPPSWRGLLAKRKRLQDS